EVSRQAGRRRILWCPRQRLMVSLTVESASVKVSVPPAPGRPQAILARQGRRIDEITDGMPDLCHYWRAGRDVADRGPIYRGVCPGAGTGPAGHVRSRAPDSPSGGTGATGAWPLDPV